MVIFCSFLIHDVGETDSLEAFLDGVNLEQQFMRASQRLIHMNQSARDILVGSGFRLDSDLAQKLAATGMKPA
jgi:hypothetical protein